jgi:hypothetical protein
VIDGVRIRVLIIPHDDDRSQTYTLRAEARQANLTGSSNPVTVTVSIGDTTGTTGVIANFD